MIPAAEDYSNSCSEIVSRNLNFLNRMRSHKIEFFVSLAILRRIAGHPAYMKEDIGFPDYSFVSPYSNIIEFIQQIATGF